MNANSASLDPAELGGMIGDLVHEHVERALPLVVGRVQAAIPAPLAGKDGAPGPQGASGTIDPELVHVVVAETLPPLVDKALEERIEALKPELKGADGQPGRDGVDGKDADSELVHVVAAEAVTEFCEEFGKALAARFKAAE